jgi:hypothetical protein
MIMSTPKIKVKLTAKESVGVKTMQVIREPKVMSEED